jgi:uncharacterized membrane protein YczE
MLQRCVRLVVGLALYGIGISLMVRAAVGVSPWDVLTQGVSRHTGIPFGWTTNLIGAAVLLLWFPIRERPGLGTVLNVLLVGPAAQLGLAVVPAPSALALRIPLFAVGLLIVAVATGLYLGAGLGPGPRDGLMTGLHRRTGKPIWLVRGGIEITVLLIGWALGGNVGVGTLAFALLIGPLVHRAMPRLAHDRPRRRDRQAAACGAGSSGIPG